METNQEANRLTSDPLARRRIVVTDPLPPASSLSSELRALGADVIELPTIRIEPPSDLRAFAELVQDAHAYDWIVFGDRHTVGAFFDLFYKLYDDAREIGAAKIAVLGAETARRVKDFHLHVDLQSEEPDALGREFKRAGGVENLRVLLAQAEEARDVLGKELSAQGGIVDQGFAYRTMPETGQENDARRRLREDGADLITFTSAAAVENFLALGSPWPNETKVASIGPVTSKKARELGLRVSVEASRHDAAGLVEAIRKFYQAKN